MLKLLQCTCPVPEFRSVIGLLTATEKQVHVGQLHMRLIQWHHKHNWRVPESLEKVIPTPRSLHPFTMMAEGRHVHWKRCTTSQPPGLCTPLVHALVLGSSGYVQPNPTEPAQYAQPVDSHSIRSLTEI